MLQNLILAALAILSIGSILYFRPMARDGGGAFRNFEKLSIPDVVFCGAVCGYFLVLVGSVFASQQISVEQIDGAYRLAIHSSQMKPQLDVSLLVTSCVIWLMIVGSLLCFLVYRGRSPIELFGLRWRDWRSGLRFAAASLLTAVPLVLLAQALSFRIFAPGTASQDVVVFLQENQTWQARLAVIGLAVFVAPISEELLFRGYVFGVVRKYIGRWSAILFSSLIFSLMHTHLPAIGGLFLLGLALVLVYEKTGSLWASIAMHSCFNAAMIVVALTWPQIEM